MNITRTASTLVALALAGGLLTACSTPASATPAPALTSSTTAPVTAATSAPAATTAPAPAPVVADQYSQVTAGGVLVQGSEAAPVRIGTDTMGQAPAVEAQMLPASTPPAKRNGSALAEANNKYFVYIFKSAGGWVWKIFGMSPYGSFRVRSDSGYQAGHYLATRNEALAGPFAVGGRVLDRAEFLEFAEQG